MLLTYILSPHIETRPVNQIPPVSAHPSAVSPSPKSLVGGNAALFLCCDRCSQTVTWFMDKMSQSDSVCQPTSPLGIVSCVSRCGCMCPCVGLCECLRVCGFVWHINHQHNYIQNNGSDLSVPIIVTAVIHREIEVTFVPMSSIKELQTRSAVSSMFNLMISNIP